MDRLWHLGGPRACSASLEIECKIPYQSSSTTTKKSASKLARVRAEFKPDVYFSRRNHSPSMIPFLHLGPLSIPTYGLMVATGLLVAAYLLQADIKRHRAHLLKRGYLKTADKTNCGPEAFLLTALIRV